MKNKKPKISVIIPAHNEERYILRPLESLEKQSFKDFETIIVLDSCTDKTKEKCLSNGCKIIEVKTKCLGKNRNIGAKNSEGEILVFIDADVRVDDNYLEEIDKAVANGFLHGRPRYYNDSSNIFVEEQLYLSNLFKMKYYPHTCFVTKKIFDSVHGYPEFYNWEDMVFSEKLRKYKGCMIDSSAYNSSRRFDKNGNFKELFSQTSSICNYFISYKLLKKKDVPNYPPVR
jgi:glycosyltransferase involved in cell wall biosynthesis